MRQLSKVALTVLVVVLAVSGCSQLAVNKDLAAPKIKFAARPFPLSQVRLLNSPFKDAMGLNQKYLHDLDSDRLLHMFRVTSGLPSSAAPYRSWEERELRGHTMGHFLSGCALTYAATGDEQLKAKADAVVAELAKCQKAFGNTGYLSAYPETFIDRVEASERVWAPYYTLHKIFAGLEDMYVYCGNKQALDIAEQMARWVKMRTDKLSEEHMQRMLSSTEQGGMNETLANLYALTGNKTYLDLSLRFNEKSYNEPLAKKQDNLTGQHANSFVPNIIGSARQYELTGDNIFQGIALFFWDQVANHRAYATGGTSNGEAWGSKPDILAKELGVATHESCVTYNMLKLTRHLFQWQPKAEYADYYERALYNGILSTIDPLTGMTMYYVPMASGWFKTFGTADNAFWCCTGTGMENHAKYGDSIYFYDDKGLFVNLFIPSKLDWPQKQLVITQHTKFPEKQSTSLIITAKKPVKMSIRIRIPYWVTGNVNVKINGQPVNVKAQPSSYVDLNRSWKNKDRIDIELPMSLRLQPMPDDANVTAIMYGPLVLAGQLGSEGITPQLTYNHYAPSVSRAEVPVLVEPDRTNLTSWIKPVADKPLTFSISSGVAKPKEVTLIPFHKLFGQHYAIYWDIMIQQQWAALQDSKKTGIAVDQERKARLIDEVNIGDDTSEKAHAFAGEKLDRGDYNEKNWVQANDGGWMSCAVKVDSEKATAVLLTYWGADTGERQFDILIDDTKIATQRIHELSPGQFVGIEYKIPDDLTKGKQTVTMKLVPHKGNRAGGIFGIATLQAKN